MFQGLWLIAYQLDDHSIIKCHWKSGHTHTQALPVQHIPGSTAAFSWLLPCFCLWVHIKQDTITNHIDTLAHNLTPTQDKQPILCRNNGTMLGSVNVKYLEQAATWVRPARQLFLNLLFFLTGYLLLKHVRWKAVLLPVGYAFKIIQLQLGSVRNSDLN